MNEWKQFCENATDRQLCVIVDRELAAHNRAPDCEERYTYAVIAVAVAEGRGLVVCQAV